MNSTTSDTDLLNFINTISQDQVEIVNQTDQVQTFIEKHKKKNTTRQTKGAVNKLRRWLLEEKLEIRPLEQLQPTELNSYLSEFFVTLTKANGDLYEPSTLKGLFN